MELPSSKDCSRPDDPFSDTFQLIQVSREHKLSVLEEYPTNHETYLNNRKTWSPNVARSSIQLNYYRNPPGIHVAGRPSTQSIPIYFAKHSPLWWENAALRHKCSNCCNASRLISLEKLKSRTQNGTPSVPHNRHTYAFIYQYMSCVSLACVLAYLLFGYRCSISCERRARARVSSDMLL